MEQIVVEPQGDQPRKTDVEVVTEVSNLGLFGRLLAFARPP
jgi:hypothetical protein